VKDRELKAILDWFTEELNTAKEYQRNSASQEMKANREVNQLREEVRVLKTRMEQVNQVSTTNEDEIAYAKMVGRPGFTQ
jgi:hypothetical protein